MQHSYKINIKINIYSYWNGYSFAACSIRMARHPLFCWSWTGL